MAVASAADMLKRLHTCCEDCAQMHKDEHARTAAEMAADPDFPKHDLSFVRLPVAQQGPDKR